jgi:hypothetical protein
MNGIKQFGRLTILVAEPLQELKATLSTASNHWGALKRMKIQKWERRSESLRGFFI